MTRFNITVWILAVVGFAGFMAPPASADIYSWTDENGVKHFTNQEPPKHATLLMKTPEIAYDEEAHEQRLEEDRLATAKAELVEKEALLLEQQLEAERRIAAANARAEAAIQEADRILQDAKTAAEDVWDDRWRGYRSSSGFYRYSPRAPYSSYKRYNLSLYKKYPHKYKRPHYKYGHHKKYGRHPYKYGHNKHWRYHHKYGHYNKHHSKSLFNNRHYRSHSGRSHHSIAGGRHTATHRGRVAAFRGRHGRF